jgi:hypothetical protein
MRSPGKGAARVVRGSLLALCCTLLALSGHVLGGGRVVEVLPMVAVAGPLGAAFVVWADRQRGPVQLAAAAAGSQVAFHLVFWLCAGAGLPGHATAGDLEMVAGHLAAGAAMTWVLSRGERALWALYRVLSTVLSRSVVRLPVVAHRSAAPAEAAWPHGCGAGLAFAAAHSRRGPPRVSAA